MSSFIQQCLEGKALVDDIEEFIELWHESDSALPLHQFLGMSNSEYSIWVADPDVLPHIINAHKQGRDVSDILEEINPSRLAARSDGPHKTDKLIRWLKNEGLWE